MSICFDCEATYNGNVILCPLHEAAEDMEGVIKQVAGRLEEDPAEAYAHDEYRQFLANILRKKLPQRGQP